MIEWQLVVNVMNKSYFTKDPSKCQYGLGHLFYDLKFDVNKR
jgi:hypothetical protein